MKRLAASLALGLTLASSAASAQQTEILVSYAIPDLFKTVHEQIAAEFMKRNPQYKVTFRAPVASYEDIAAQVLREAVTGQLPDVAYQGLNRQRIFVDRGLAVDLGELIAAEADWSKAGYSDALLDLGRVQGKQYGIGFSLSTPIVYYNLDLVKKAGGDPDKLPTTWDGVFDLAKKIKATGAEGFHFDWDITGNWMWQALIFSNGGKMLSPDEKKVAFDGPAGQAAIAALARMVEEGTMRDVKSSVSRTDFIAGNLGIWSHSTSQLGNITRQVGEKFALKTGVFPTPAADGRLPSGGNAAMIFSKDPVKRKAAWEYVKFATGPVGATMMVKATGYFPANTIPANDPDMLVEFYKANPNHLTAIRQLDKLTGWYAFPGENGLKITDVMNDHLQSVVAKRAKPADALAVMTKDVQALLPK